MSDIQKLRQFFEANAGRSIPLPRLGKVISPYSIRQRITELRQAGLRIENRRTRTGPRVHSSYRYVA